MDFFSLGILVAVCVGVSITKMGVCHGSQIQSHDFISWADFSMERFSGKFSDDGSNARTIVVSKNGMGDWTTVQGAIDMVPHGNAERVKIWVSPGVYREKVVIPITKPYISLIGKGSSETVISWDLKASDRDSNGNIVGTLNSASFAVESEYFCAHGITFENTAPGATPGSEGTQAVALRLSADKAMLYRCRILGTQDTLFDHMGKHYFYECYIQGSIDFIFGHARSLYETCTLHAVATSYGAIAASQRNSLSEDSGFSFVNCTLNGSGILYLGRAWGQYATVVFSYCQFEDIIIPERWSDWGDQSRRSTVWFGEFNCNGRGAIQSERVSWARSLTYDEARPFLNRNYVDGDRWLLL